MSHVIVTDHRTLRGMEIAGYINRNGHAKSRERHWSGLPVRVCHVSEGPKLKHWSQRFTYRGHEYQLHYFDGCFHPFVCRMDTGFPLPSFV
jgi:hypothetical protein